METGTTKRVGIITLDGGETFLLSDHGPAGGFIRRGTAAARFDTVTDARAYAERAGWAVSPGPLAIETAPHWQGNTYYRLRRAQTLDAIRGYEEDGGSLQTPVGPARTLRTLYAPEELPQGTTIHKLYGGCFAFLPGAHRAMELRRGQAVAEGAYQETVRPLGNFKYR